ncbi:hypothetical protein ACLOJK_034485 [Asimina triloba]
MPILPFMPAGSLVRTAPGVGGAAGLGGRGERGRSTGSWASGDRPPLETRWRHGYCSWVEGCGSWAVTVDGRRWTRWVSGEMGESGVGIALPDLRVEGAAARRSASVIDVDAIEEDEAGFVDLPLFGRNDRDNRRPVTKERG